MAKDEKKTISVNEIEYNLDDLTDEPWSNKLG